MSSATVPSVEDVTETAMDWLEGAKDWVLTDGQEWTVWIGVSIGVFLVLRFLRALFAGFIKSGNQPANSVRNLVGAVIANTKQLYLLGLSFTVTAPFLMEFSEDKETILPTALTVLTIIQLVIWIRIVALGLLDSSLSKNQADPRSAASFRTLIGLFLNIGLFAIGAIMVLNNLGVDATGLIAGLGVGGIAIGLAAQSLFEDLFAGMSIMMDRPFVRGDMISFDDKFGTVEKVGLKTTRLRTLQGEQLSITNSNLLDYKIQNFKLMTERRSVFRVGILYQTPHNKLRELPDQIRAIVESRQKCRFDRCHLAAYGASSIDFECVYYVKSPEYVVFMDEQHEIYLAIHKLFEDNGLDFAYPTQTIFIEKDDTDAVNNGPMG